MGSGTDVSYRGVNAGTSRRREPCRYLRGRRGATGLARRRFREARISPLGVLAADGVVQGIQSDFATDARGVNLTP